MKLKISNAISDKERAYINNLITSGAGQVREKGVKLSDKTTHELVVEKGFVVGAKKVIRQEGVK